MSAAKISALTALTGATLDVGDFFVVVDTSATTTKKISVIELFTNVLVDGAAAGTSGAGVVAIKTGTAPGSAPADEVQIYSKDKAAGDARLWVLSETGGAVMIGNGGVDVGAAGTLTLGVALATAITVSATGVTTTVAGPLACSEGAAVTGTITGTSSSASALAVGRQGATSPALQVDANTASCVTGLKVTAGASGGGLAIAVVGGGAAEAATFDAKGAGTVGIGTVSTGATTIGATSIPLIVPGPLTRGVGASTAAAGSTFADAGALPAGTAGVYPTTAADDTTGVIIHANDKVTGRMLLIGNGVSNKILKVYGPSGAVINGAAANAAFSSASGKGVIAVCLSGAGNTWLMW